MSETRNVLDANDNVIGTLTLPDNTPEDVWTRKLAEFKYTNPTMTTEEKVQAIMEAAMEFGKQLMKEFAAENVLLGITQAGMTNTVRKRLSEVTNALLTGSLYDAIYEVRQIPPEHKDDTFITDARLLVFINKIEKYLLIPLSTQL